jgi:hypothetical protein
MEPSFIKLLKLKHDWFELSTEWEVEEMHKCTPVVVVTSPVVEVTCRCMEEEEKVKEVVGTCKHMVGEEMEKVEVGRCNGMVEEERTLVAVEMCNGREVLALVTWVEEVENCIRMVGEEKGKVVVGRCNGMVVEEMG